MCAKFFDEIDNWTARYFNLIKNTVLWLSMFKKCVLKEFKTYSDIIFSFIGLPPGFHSIDVQPILRKQTIIPQMTL